MSEPVIEKMRGNLTKRFYFQIPTGLFLVSRIDRSKNKPIFAEKVVPLSERRSQWKTIMEIGIAQRLCYVFADKKDYEKWLKQYSG